MPNKKTLFQEEWLSVKEFAGITAHKLHADEKGPATHAFCSFCKKSFGLSNMGREAINSHVKGKRHQEKIRSMNSSYGIKMFTTSNPGAKTTDATGQETSTLTAGVSAEVSTGVENPQPGASLPGPSLPGPSTPRSDFNMPPSPLPPVLGTATTALRGLQKYVLRDEVTNAEILWALHCCVNHMSLSTGGKSVKLFSRMFPDSVIASKMELGRQKLAYVLVFGIARYFNELLLDELKECKDIVMCFDESMNKFAQRQQMDLAVRFWSRSKDEVCTRYFTSAFLGRTRSIDLLAEFKANVPEILLKLLLMLSMDGPNVNFKFLKDLRADLPKSPDDRKLLLMGSCGIHVVHNAFKTGAVKTGWELALYLRSSYNIFDGNPARKAVFAQCTSEVGISSDASVAASLAGSDTDCDFPLSFCPVRWLVNGPVAETAVKILPKMKTFVKKVEAKDVDIAISSPSYQAVAKAVKDPLLACKLAFFGHTARQLEPFMTVYQTDAPLAPFLYTDLNELVTKLMERFVKSEVVSKSSDVCKINLSDSNNLIRTRDFKLIHSVKAELRQVKVKERQILEFRGQCIVMLKAICEKIIEKSPLKYPLCKAITFCDPAVIYQSLSVSLKRLGTALTCYQECNILSPMECDTIESEFQSLISKPSVCAAMGGFRKDTRLDHFWRNVLKMHDCSDLLTNFIHSVLILSHGNAFVERGYSVNKEMIIENQLTTSLVGLRQVYDGVQAMGGMDNVNVDKKMMSKARHARSEWEQFRMEKNKLAKISETEKREKRAIVEEVKELKAKRVKLLLEKEQAMSETD